MYRRLRSLIASPDGVTGPVGAVWATISLVLTYYA